MITEILMIATCACVGLTVFILFNSYIKDNEDKYIMKQSVKKYYTTHNMDELYSKASKDRKKQRIADKIHVSQKFADDVSIAGLPVTPSEFLILWIGLTLGLILIGYLATGNSITAAGAGMFGFMIPLLIFRYMKNKRMMLFSEQLGDALLTMSNSIKAGFSFQQAINTAAQELPDPIGAEFKRVVREMSYGVTQETALYNMYKRTHNEDVKMLTSAIAISAKTGGNLSDVLTTISNTVRSRIAIRQKVKTLSAQGKTSAVIVGILPIALLGVMMVMNPDYLQPMFTDHRGIIMLIAAVIMEIIGFFFMKKITDIEL